MRTRRTKEQIAVLEQQIIDVLAADNPQSVRHVFYRMTNPRLAAPVAKSEKGYRDVQQRLVTMRKVGRLSYGWIADHTRRGFHVNTFDTGADFIRRMAAGYRYNLWADVDVHVEVWVESRSLAGVLQPVCNDTAVSLYPPGGFSSITLTYEAGEYVARTGKGRMICLYIGDYDPAGLLIDRCIEEALRGHLEGHGIALDFKRLGINPQQIVDYDLPAKPRTDSNSRRPDVQETVEAGAMPANVMRGLVRDAVESYLPAGALEHAKLIEVEERKDIITRARMLL